MPSNPDDPIDDVALAWLIKACSGEMGTRQEQLLSDWLEQDPKHRQAFFEAQALWQGLGQLKGRPFVADNLAKLKAVPHRPYKPTPDTSRTTQIRYRQFPLQHAYLAAACLVFAAILCPFMMGMLKIWNADHQTAVGEQKTITLADGSKVYLNAHSALDINFTPRQRRLELLTGEAEFEVSKDAARPFIVVANTQEVKALGTDFVVKLNGDAVKISVVESAVKVSQPEDATVPPVTVRRGKQITVFDHQSPDGVIAIKPENASPWRSNRLIFESEPLAQVVEDINRYRPGHVFLVRPSLAELKVSGVFNLDEIENLLAVLGKTLPVKTASLGDRYVLLY